MLLLFFFFSLPSRPDHSCSVNLSLSFIPTYPRTDSRYKRPDNYQSILHFFLKLSRLGITLLNNSLHERNNHRDKRARIRGIVSKTGRILSYHETVNLIIGVCSSTFSRSFTVLPLDCCGFLAMAWRGRRGRRRGVFCLPFSHPPAPSLSLL